MINNWFIASNMVYGKLKPWYENKTCVITCITRWKDISYKMLMNLKKALQGKIKGKMFKVISYCNTLKYISIKENVLENIILENICTKFKAQMALHTMCENLASTIVWK